MSRSDPAATGLCFCLAIPIAVGDLVEDVDLIRRIARALQAFQGFPQRVLFRVRGDVGHGQHMGALAAIRIAFAGLRVGGERLITQAFEMEAL